MSFKNKIKIEKILDYKYIIYNNSQLINKFFIKILKMKLILYCYKEKNMKKQIRNYFKKYKKKKKKSKKLNLKFSNLKTN